MLITVAAAVLASTGTAAATVGDPITPTSNWSTNAGYNSAPAMAYLDNNGLVHVSGAVTRVNTSGLWTQIATLPAGYAPDHNVLAIAHTFAGSYTDLLIDSGGIFVMPAHSPANSDYRFVSLEGIVYDPHASVYTIRSHRFNSS